MRRFNKRGETGLCNARPSPEPAHAQPACCSPLRQAQLCQRQVSKGTARLCGQSGVLLRGVRMQRAARVPETENREHGCFGRHLG